MRKGFLLFAAACLTVFIYSCKDDEAQEPPCGFSLAKFTGTWNIIEKCDTNEYSYPLVITEDSASGIILANLGGFGANSIVNATVDGDQFSIPQQFVQSYMFAGNGSLNDGCAQLVIQWTGSPKGFCAVTGTR